jgi:hypothetical protein
VQQCTLIIVPVTWEVESKSLRPTWALKVNVAKPVYMVSILKDSQKRKEKKKKERTRRKEKKENQHHHNKTELRNWMQ